MENLPTVAALLQAMDDAMAAIGTMPPQSMGIHPDDLHELRREVPPYVVKTDTLGTYLFTGITLIEDPKAERLPRKPGP